MKGNKIQRVDDYYNPADLLGRLGLQPGAMVPLPGATGRPKMAGP